MALYLTIDQGNTAAKLALWRGEKLEETHIVQSLVPASLAQFIANHPGIEAAIYCSVASHGTEIMATLNNSLRKAIKLTGNTPLPINIEYGTMGSLGVDRIAAAVGAQASFPGTPLLVVDAGTAVTYDAVTADGRFIGGNIAPGMNMRLEALHRFTARLPRVKVPRELPTGLVFGNNTEAAMILGAIYGIVGAMSYYKSRLPENTKVVMTGGWAGELSRLCDFDINVDPHLVSKGLNRILIYNENN
jgi:type III pantothenate kinase